MLMTEITCALLPTELLPIAYCGAVFGRVRCEGKNDSEQIAHTTYSIRMVRQRGIVFTMCAMLPIVVHHFEEIVKPYHAWADTEHAAQSFIANAFIPATCAKINGANAITVLFLMISPLLMLSVALPKPVRQQVGSKMSMKQKRLAKQHSYVLQTTWELSPQRSPACQALQAAAAYISMRCFRHPQSTIHQLDATESPLKHGPGGCEVTSPCNCQLASAGRSIIQAICKCLTKALVGSQPI